MGRGDFSELDDVLRGPAAVNASVPVASLQEMWNVTPGDPFTDLQDFDVVNAWDELNGGTLSLVSNLNRLSTDGTQAASEAVLETAAIGVYQSGTKVVTAGGWTGWDDPVDSQFYEWGYGRSGGESHVYWRRTADDLQIRPANEISGEKTLSRSAGHFDHGNVTFLDGGSNEVDDPEDAVLRVIGLDPLDGNGPSNIDFNGSLGYVSGFKLGWYGPSTTVPYVSTVGDVAGNFRERTFDLCIIQPLGEPLITRPNEPWLFRASNGGSAPGSGSGLQIDTGGRQFSFNGDFTGGREDVTHQTQQMSIPMDGTGATVDLPDGTTREWYVIAVFKRETDNEETAVSIGRLGFRSNNDIQVHARVIPESDLSGTLEYNEPSDTHGESTYVVQDAQPDTPTRVTIDTATIDGRTRLLGKSWGGDLVAGGGQTNKFTVGSTDSFRLQFVRNNPVVLVATTPDGTSATFTANYPFPGVQ